MGKFSEAMRQGIEAQARLNQTQSELCSVLKEVSADLSESASRELQVVLTGRTKWIEGFQTKFGEIMGILPEKRQREVWTIEVNSAGSPPVLLAEVTFEEIGYPVSVRWPERYLQASDRDGFSGIMEQLLRSRYAGEKIEPLLKVT